jgi:microbial collagenase
MKAILCALCIAVLAGGNACARASALALASADGSTDGSAYGRAVGPQKNEVDVAAMAARKYVLPMPHRPSLLPPTQAERQYHLPSTDRLRLDLIPPDLRSAMRADEPAAHAQTCSDMTSLAAHRGDELADYLMRLPDADCLTPLFSVAPALAQTIFSHGNLATVAQRYASVGASYASAGTALANLSVFLRAGYSLANQGDIDAIGDDVLATLRPAITALFAGEALFAPNASAPTTAGTVALLVTDMHDEANYLDLAKRWVARLTNTPAGPNAALALDDANVGYGFTGLLTIFYFSHTRADALPRLESDPSFATTLYRFVASNKASLLQDARASYQLEQAANEAFRFAQHPALLPLVRSMMTDALAHSTMAGPDRILWLSAAQAVQAYDEANCSFYKTCNFEHALAAAILSKQYWCHEGVVRLRTQSLTRDEARTACANLIDETPYFHAMLATHERPVADDNDRTLEVVVFSDREEYHRYSPVFFGNDVDNGGVYLEGDPAAPENQSRFIAFVATWLRPRFEIWNLKHEFVHYLDGRYDMYGDFEAATQAPDVWWIEGLAEYISRGNDDQESIDAARTAQYRLHDIFANTYTMDDYVNRAYRWGYMAVRFMFERHAESLAVILPMFRAGQYRAYWAYMQQLPATMDDEFAQWVQTTTTAGTPQPPGRAR